MKFSTGWAALAALFFAVPAANGQGAPNGVGAPYTAASDFDGPYAAMPPEAPAPRYGYGPSLLPATEVYTVLRENGFSPLGIPRLRGSVYTIAVIDRRGGDGRLVIDARDGRIVRFLPARGIGFDDMRGRPMGRRAHCRRRPSAAPRRGRRPRFRMSPAAACRCRSRARLRPSRRPPPRSRLHRRSKRPSHRSLPPNRSRRRHSRPRRPLRPPSDRRLRLQLRPRQPFFRRRKCLTFRRWSNSSSASGLRTTTKNLPVSRGVFAFSQYLLKHLALDGGLVGRASTTWAARRS